MENINNKSGWFERPNFLTGKAPIHQEVSRKKEYVKEFGGKKTLIKPKHTVFLHFNIDDKDFDKFTDAALVDFRKEYEVIDITISRDENNKTVVELPRDKAILFHDYILGKNSKFGTTDINDLNELIKLQEDSLEKIPIQDIDTRLRVLR
jgi:hypothetical protein